MNINVIREFADFLREYGPYAGTALAFTLFFVERRAHSATRREYIQFLIASPKELKEFAKEQSIALTKLESTVARMSRKVQGDKDG